MSLPYYCKTPSTRSLPVSIRRRRHRYGQCPFPVLKIETLMSLWSLDSTQASYSNRTFQQ